MNMIDKQAALQAVLDKTVDKKKIFGTSFAIKKMTQSGLEARETFRPTNPISLRVRQNYLLLP